MAGVDEVGKAVIGTSGSKWRNSASSEQHPKTDRERAVEYLHHVNSQFQKPEIQGLVDEVLKLLAGSPYAARIERQVIGMKGVAVTSHYINQELNLTLRAKLPFGSSSLPNYRAYAQRNLAEIVKGYTPTKKSA